MSATSMLRGQNPFFERLLDLESSGHGEGWLESHALKLYLADRLLCETMPEVSDAPAPVVALFGGQHSRSLSRELYSFLLENNQALAEGIATAPSREVDHGTGLSSWEMAILGLLCYLHDVGVLLHPRATDEEQRASAADFVLANSPILNLSEADAAIISSLVNVVTLADAAGVHDWKEDHIRCRLLAAALAFGHLLDAGHSRLRCARLDSLAHEAFPVVPRLLLPHLLIHSAAVRQVGANGRPAWLVDVSWWAPSPRQGDGEAWLRRYLEETVRHAEPGWPGEVKLDLKLVDPGSQRAMIEHAFPTGALEPWEARRTKSQERVVVLRRLLTANGFPAGAFRPTCQWLIVNFVSSKEFCDHLRDEPAPDALRAAICASPTWNWQEVKTAVADPETAICFHTRAVELALDPRRYGGQAEFGEQVAKLTADLIRGGLYAPPIELVEKLVPAWCDAKGRWLAVAAEAILGPPSLFGRATPDGIGHLVPTLLAAAADLDADEFADLVHALRDPIRKLTWTTDTIATFLAHLTAPLRSTRSDQSVTRILRASAILLGTLPPSLHREGLLLRHVVRPIRLRTRGLPQAALAERLRELSSSWSSLPPEPWLQLATEALQGYRQGSANGDLARLLRVISGFLGRVQASRSGGMPPSVLLRRRLRHLEGELRRISNDTDGRQLTVLLAARCRELCQMMSKGRES